MNSYYKFLLVAIASYVLGLSFSFLKDQNSLSRDTSKTILVKNISEVQKNNNSLLSKLKSLVSRFTTPKSQEDLVSDIPYYELKKKIEEFDNKHREIVKEKLDPNDVYSKENPNQSVVNDFVKEFLDSKKEWLTKEIYLDKFKKDKLVIFSKVNECKWRQSWVKVKTFENKHCYDQDIFFKVGKKWTRTGRMGGISWFNFYKNKPVIEVQLSDIRELINFRVVYIYIGLEDNNDEVFGLRFLNEAYAWENFESTNWEEATELERKKIEEETSKQE